MDGEKRKDREIKNGSQQELGDLPSVEKASSGKDDKK